MEKLTVITVQMMIENLREAGTRVDDAYVALQEAKNQLQDAEIEIVKLFAREGRWYDLALTPATRKAIMKD